MESSSKCLLKGNEMAIYKTRYLAKTNEGKEWKEISVDLAPFLDDGLSEQVAIETALEIFERNCNNFIEW